MTSAGSPGNIATQVVDEDALLRVRARELIQIGVLPKRPDRMWGGFGSGCLCLLCGAAITPEEAEVEAEFTSVDGGGAVVQRFHARCYVTAESEFRNPCSDGKQNCAREAIPATPALTVSGHSPQERACD